MRNWSVLKLDSSFKPVQIIDWQKAFSMIFSGRAFLIEIRDGEYIRSAYEEYPVPCVIASKRYIKRGSIQINCNRANVFWRDSHTCLYCNKVFTESSLTLDHVMPKSRGGKKVWENIVTSCHNCNQKKGNRLPHEAGMKLNKQPSRPTAKMFRFCKNGKIHSKWLPYLNFKQGAVIYE